MPEGGLKCTFSLIATTRGDESLVPINFTTYEYFE